MEYKVDLPIGKGYIDFDSYAYNGLSAGIKYDFYGPDRRYYIRQANIFEKEFDQYADMFRTAIERYNQLLETTPPGIKFEERIGKIYISNNPGLEDGLTLYKSPFHSSKFPIKDKQHVQLIIDSFQIVRNKILELSLIEGNTLKLIEINRLLQVTKVEDKMVYSKILKQKQLLEQKEKKQKYNEMRILFFVILCILLFIVWLIM